MDIGFQETAEENDDLGWCFCQYGPVSRGISRHQPELDCRSSQRRTYSSFQPSTSIVFPMNPRTLLAKTRETGERKRICKIRQISCGWQIAQVMIFAWKFQFATSIVARNKSELELLLARAPWLCWNLALENTVIVVNASRLPLEISPVNRRQLLVNILPLPNP